MSASVHIPRFRSQFLAPCVTGAPYGTTLNGTPMHVVNVVWATQPARPREVVCSQHVGRRLHADGPVNDGGRS